MKTVDLIHLMNGPVQAPRICQAAHCSNNRAPGNERIVSIAVRTVDSKRTTVTGNLLSKTHPTPYIYTTCNWRNATGNWSRILQRPMNLTLPASKLSSTTQGSLLCGSSCEKDIAKDPLSDPRALLECPWLSGLLHFRQIVQIYIGDGTKSITIMTEARKYKWGRASVDLLIPLEISLRYASTLVWQKMSLPKGSTLAVSFFVKNVASQTWTHRSRYQQIQAWTIEEGPSHCTDNRWNTSWELTPWMTLLQALTNISIVVCSNPLWRQPLRVLNTLV